MRAMWMMLQQDEPCDYVIGTGESHTVREFCELAFAHVGLDWEEFVRIDPAYYRPTEVEYLRGRPDPGPRASSAGSRRSRSEELVERDGRARPAAGNGLDLEEGAGGRQADLPGGGARVTAEPIFDLSGKRVWVAGHTGLVGSAIVRRLESEADRRSDHRPVVARWT